MNKIKILWADDEIDLLKSQITFLEDKGYEVRPITNGLDAVDAARDESFDVIFLDENMPGISGLETLCRIKAFNTLVPVVMITKSEEENIMEEAIGSQIADYLIKPVKPNQILLCLKKLIDGGRLITEKTTSNYRQEFQRMSLDMNSIGDAEGWADAYKKMLHWELELDRNDAREMQEVFSMQKAEANKEFGKFISRNYLQWMNTPSATTPLLSHQVLKQKVLPFLNEQQSTFLVVIDNLRFDQWKMIQPVIQELFKMETEESYYAILPTATQYARNAMFAGLLPADIQKQFPQYWVEEGGEHSLNNFEAQLLFEQLKRNKLDIKHSYTKVSNHEHGLQLVSNIQNMMHNKLNVIVYNFIDMLSHARSEMDLLKELAPDEKAYRSVTLSWFQNSPLWEALQKVASKNIQLIITTDHGTVRVQNPIKMVSDRATTSNLRFKSGKNISINEKEVLVFKRPEEARLPPRLGAWYIFTRDNDFLVYANNYNQYVNMYRDTFQHGGISLEEIIVPIVRMTSK